LSTRPRRERQDPTGYGWRGDATGTPDGKDQVKI
jgi:hypothetical protein